MKRFTIIVSALALFASCHKPERVTPIVCCGPYMSEAANADYFIFGFWAQMGCNYYMIKKDTLYAASGCQHDTLNFITALPEAKYIKALSLKYNLPPSISGLTDTVLGCPNCVDQGGWYIEYRLGSRIKKYNLDNDTALMPVSIKNYIMLLQATRDGLK